VREEFKKKFDKDFLDKIEDAYDEFSKKFSEGIPKKEHSWYDYQKGWFFSEAEQYKGGHLEQERYNKMSYLQNHYKHCRGLLHPPNLATLAYVEERLEIFQDLVFLDYGAGIGTLGAFLHHLGIKCYSYDTFEHSERMREAHLNKLLQKRGLFCEPVVDELPKLKIDVMCCHGIQLQSPPEYQEQDYKYVFADPHYGIASLFHKHHLDKMHPARSHHPDSREGAIVIYEK
tara:strand:+ start:11651 stop:12340 length:690 start_codon:yes stop_codon:yes gene_type:complete